MNLPQETEWPANPHLQLHQALDERARCSICHEFYRTPLSLPCAHTFCSACIRGNIAFQEQHGGAKCPQCRTPCDARDLRPNLALKDVLAAYLAVRGSLVEAVEAAQLARQPPAALQQQSDGDVQILGVGKEPARTGRQQQSLRQRRGNYDSEAGPKPVHAVAATQTDAQPGFRADTVGSTAASAEQLPPSTRQLRKRPASALKASTEPGSPVSLHSLSGTDADFVSPSPQSAKRRRVSQAPAKLAKVQTPAVSTLAAAASRQPAAPNLSAAASDFLPCPICNRQIKKSFADLHVNTCLEQMEKSAKAGVSRAKPQHAQHASHQALPIGQQMPHASAFLAATGRAKAKAAVGGPGKRAKPRLTVPPKLVWNLLGSDKAVRDKLKAVNLPTKGSRKVMEERYHRYRVMVETAIDAGEHVTHQQLLERLAAREKGLADAAEDQPRVRAVKQAAPAGASASFEDLIAATKSRDKGRRSDTPQPQQAAAMAQCQHAVTEPRDPAALACTTPLPSAATLAAEAQPLQQALHAHARPALTAERHQQQHEPDTCELQDGPLRHADVVIAEHAMHESRRQPRSASQCVAVMLLPQHAEQHQHSRRAGQQSGAAQPLLHGTDVQLADRTADDAICTETGSAGHSLPYQLAPAGAGSRLHGAVQAAAPHASAPAGSRPHLHRDEQPAPGTAGEHTQSSAPQVSGEQGASGSAAQEVQWQSNGMPPQQQQQRHQLAVPSGHQPACQHGQPHGPYGHCSSQQGDLWADHDWRAYPSQPHSHACHPGGSQTDAAIVHRPDDAAQEAPKQPCSQARAEPAGGAQLAQHAQRGPQYHWPADSDDDILGSQNSSRLANGPLDRVASAPEPDHRKASHGRAIPAGHVADGIVIDVDGDGSEDETVEDSEPEDDIGSQPGQRHGAHGFAPQQAPHAALRFQYS